MPSPPNPNKPNDYAVLKHRIYLLEKAIGGNGQEGLTQKVETHGQVASQARLIAAVFAVVFPAIITVAMGLGGYLIFDRMVSIEDRFYHHELTDGHRTMEERVATLRGDVEEHLDEGVEGQKHPFGVIGLIQKLEERVTERFAEIETQFGRMSDNVNNEDETLRLLLGEIWKRVMDSDLPNRTHYPEVEKHNFAP